VLEELRKRNVEVLLTARNMYQVMRTAGTFRDALPGRRRPLGKKPSVKDSVQLRPGCAAPASRSSRAAAPCGVAWITGSVIDFEAARHSNHHASRYEHSIKTGFLEADWIFMPD